MNTYFISGHLDLSEARFDMEYKPKIDEAIKGGSHFVVGDAKGADTIAQCYLRSLGYWNVTVYHMFDKPRQEIGFKTMGGFTSDEQRDEAMTRDSTHDILWIRGAEETKFLLGKKYKPGYISGTEKNRLRRALKKE